MDSIPQHAVFSFPNIEFSSDFDSGNICKVEQSEENSYQLWTGPDAMGTPGENTCRTWFYFKASTTPGLSYKFTIMNLNSQSKLYKDGMKPVYSSDQENWKFVESQIDYATNNGNFEVTWNFSFTDSITFFAFSFPWSLEQNSKLLTDLEAICEENSIFFYKENLVNSLEGRPCDLITVTSKDGMEDKREKKISGLFPDNKERCFKFNNKKVIFVSSRVHPGEVPSSHVMNGFLKFIVSQDPRAESLRRSFVFKIIPILNPDGVFRGFYRTDTKGQNLNRFYTSPLPQDHPTIFGSKELFTYYQELYEVFLYVDLHGHAAKKGCFVYGNYLDFKDQIETCLFAKLMTLNCPNFDLQACNFTESNMRAKDKRDGLSKEGSGRVAFFKQTGIIRCYTLECNYNTGKVVNKVSEPDDDINDTGSQVYQNGVPKYTAGIYEDVGRAIAVTALDLAGLNPRPRYSSFAQVRLDTAAYVSTLIPFRFDPAIRKAGKSLMELENYFVEKNKDEKKPPRPDKKPLVSRNKSDGKANCAQSKDFIVVLVKETGNSGKVDIEAKERGRDRSSGKKSRPLSKDRKECTVLQSKEMVFIPQVKESSSQRGRSMNRRVARTIITHSSSLNPKRVEI